MHTLCTRLQILFFLNHPTLSYQRYDGCFSNEREKGKIKEMLVISPRSFHYEPVCTYEPDSRFILFCKRLIDQHAEVRKPHVSDSYYILKEVVS